MMRMVVLMLKIMMVSASSRTHTPWSRVRKVKSEFGDDGLSLDGLRAEIRVIIGVIKVLL